MSEEQQQAGDGGGHRPPLQRADVLIGRKLPGNALWEQLQRRAQPLALEFCSVFFNGEMSYKQAQKWLMEYGIKISVKSLQGFYNSMEMRLRFASLQAEQNAMNAAEQVLPADLEKATRDRIQQSMFEMAHLNLGENQRLQLIALQQQRDGMKGNYELKRARLDLERQKFQRVAVKNFLDWYEDKTAREIVTSNMSQADKIERLGQAMFGDDWGGEPPRANVPEATGKEAAA